MRVKRPLPFVRGIIAFKKPRLGPLQFDPDVVFQHWKRHKGEDGKGARAYAPRAAQAVRRQRVAMLKRKDARRPLNYRTRIANMMVGQP